MARYEVALHLFFEDTGAAGHGFTDSARYVVEASSHDEAIVLATQQALGEPSGGHRIASATPSVRQVAVAHGRNS